MFKLEIRYAYTVSLQQLDAQSVREQLLCTISERTAWLSKHLHEHRTGMNRMRSI